MSRRTGPRPWMLLLIMGGLISGCGTSVKEIRRHPQQARLERLLSTVLPHTTPSSDRHDWIRVTEPTQASLGLAVLPQRHVYLSSTLIEQADEVVLAALVAHGVAHHRLHHDAQRNAVNLVQRAAFKAGGFFVPGLSHGYRLGGPLMEITLSAGQEPAADAKTLEYLRDMGRPEQDWLAALEFLVAHGYAEQVGHITHKREDFTNRIAAIRHRLSAPSAPASAAE